MSLYQIGKTWYAYITHNGERVRRSAGTTDKKSAQRFHDELKASLWAQTARPSGRTWQDACTTWLKAAARSKSDRYTLRAMGYADRPLSECTAESFEPVLAGKTAGTANRHRALIVAILTLAGIKIKIPMRKPKAGRLRFLTEAEWKRLYATLPGHLKPLAAFSIATGLRQANVTHLRWNQVDLARKVMWIHPDQAKGGKAIGIPLSDDAATLLRAQIGKSDEWVFPYAGRGRKDAGPHGVEASRWLAAQSSSHITWAASSTARLRRNSHCSTGISWGASRSGPGPRSTAAGSGLPVLPGMAGNVAGLQSAQRTRTAGARRWRSTAAAQPAAVSTVMRFDSRLMRTFSASSFAFAAVISLSYSAWRSASDRMPLTKPAPEAAATRAAKATHIQTAGSARTSVRAPVIIRSRPHHQHQHHERQRCNHRLGAGQVSSTRCALPQADARSS